MPSQVATAYVQIIPSAQGIGGGIAQALGGDAAATSAGQSFGGKLVGAIKGVIAAAGIGTALSKAITEGAALEQSIGGVETLFGDAASQVIAAADNAFATAGLSANAYMETVTGFSARLLQGLGGDTQAAAALADTAVTDMADNANKMGTSMETITQTYQSLARGNYEMLDNLKLGYGGTQSEMARLINDSGVLGDTMVATAENVNSIGFDKMIEAIHVVQTEMGITGTTAMEAETTITGSLSALQASFSNVLANLTLGRDLGPSLNALATTLTTFLTGNLLPAVWNILSALPGALVTFVSTLGPQLVSGLQTMVPQILTSGTQLIQSLGDGFVQGIPEFLANALPMVLQFTEQLRANFGTMVDAGIDLLLNLVQGIADALPTLIEYVPQIVSNIAGLINDNAPKILSAGVQVIVTLVKGLINAVPTIIDNIPQIIRAIVDTITAFNWLNLGATVIKTIGNGLVSMAGALKGFMQSTLSGALDYIKSLPGQALKWGKDLISGFVDGIIGSVGNLINSVKNVAATVASYLHFSRPDVGPLREYEQWMPDMMSGLAKGITSNIYRVTDAMGQLTAFMAEDLQPNAMATNRMRTALTSGAPGASTAPARPGLYGTADTAALLQEVIDLLRMILEAVYGIHIGDDDIGRANARYQASRAIMLGGTV
ncbi:MAG TPA: hypothetical protein H9846_02790 [Candidatus Gemmiger excrementipullorum]|uniref:Uncharacterized protein n=1 Tax=Candidatus Gemmiger excrementipullorum TaxID=2838610 RepID=A0A9D1XZH0_9FIRM|nr:hypothetical protein [Candidatus Gemmiger excrementipullorum]